MASNDQGHHQDKASHAKVDEELWDAVRDFLPRARPPRGRLPYDCGTLEYQDSGGPVRVSLVDGNVVLIEHDDDFVEGGNGYEDSGLCGKQEVVLDWLHDLDDLKFILYHECYERRLMRTRKLEYGHAHTLTNASEMALRRRETTEEPSHNGLRRVQPLRHPAPPAARQQHLLEPAPPGAVS